MINRVIKPTQKDETAFRPQPSQFALRSFPSKGVDHEVLVEEPRVSFSLADIDILPRETVQPKLRKGTVGDRHEKNQNSPLPNRTGMPDRLKAGIESLSGIDMSDVRVHANSGKPAQLNALAYTQGNQIYLGPGQEKHLPHEAWHVVQQKQGRVRATMLMKVIGINDDPSLENEADMMRAKAKHFVPSSYEEILRTIYKKEGQKSSQVDVAQCVGRATFRDKENAYRRYRQDFEDAKNWSIHQPEGSRKFYLGPRDATFSIYHSARTRQPGPEMGYIRNRAAYNPDWNVSANDAMIEGLSDANTRFRIASDQGEQIEEFLRINNIHNSSDLFMVLGEKFRRGQCPRWALSTDGRSFSVTMRELGILLDEGYTPLISDRKPGREATKGKKLTFMPRP